MIEHCPDADTIVVEDYLKWYDLHVVRADGTVYPLQKDQRYEKLVTEFSSKFTGTIWCDHCINPGFIVFLTTKLFLVDRRSMEVIVGRWVMQHDGHYDY